MKKLTLSGVFVFITILSSAQVSTAIFGGPQITSSKYTIANKKQAATNKYGFQAGTTLKVPFENKLYFAPAAFYSLKGYKVQFNQRSLPPDSTAIDNNTTIHTFELAALLQYDFNNRPNHFFVKFGPSLDFQLSGNEKFTTKTHTIKEQKMAFSFTKYGRFAANLILQVGYETKGGILLFGQYSHGIGSMNNADFGPKIFHRAYGISIGKYLRQKWFYCPKKYKPFR